MNMTGRKMNQAEKGIGFLINSLGYKQGKKIKTGATYKGRSITRPDIGTGDYFLNCIWTFNKPDNGKINMELDCAMPNLKLDLEIDGMIFHDRERDINRDAILKYNEWNIIRIPSDCVYETFIPLAYKLKEGVK